MSTPCEEIEQSMIVGDSPSADQDNHIAGCVRCQMTQHMTKQIETELQKVPSSQAHKPLWIREMHARGAIVRRRRTWLLGGICLAAASALLLLVLPIGMRSEVETPVSEVAVIESARHSGTSTSPPDSADTSDQINASRMTSEGIQFRLSFRNEQGMTSPTRLVSDIIERRLEQQFDVVKASISGQKLYVEIGVNSDNLAEEITQVQAMLVAPIGELRFSIGNEGSPVMKALYERAGGESATESGIRTGIDTWVHDATGRQFTDYYVSAEDTDIASGRQILKRYLADTINFQDDGNHNFAFGLLEKKNAPTQAQHWRSYLLQTNTVLQPALFENASVFWNPKSNRPEVLVEMQETTASAFAQLTASNVGRRIAITLDDTVVSAPVVMSTIDSRSLAIKVGGQDPEAVQRLATDLVKQIEMGPLSVEIDSWTRVGQTLSE